MRSRSSTVGAFFLAVALCCGSSVMPTAWAGQVSIETGGGLYSLSLTSLSEARFQRIVRQRYDYSCGSAAIATLLSFHYGLPTSEDTVFSAMFGVGDQDRIRAEGFSMLDMKQYLDSLGFASDGFRMTLDKIERYRIPGIALIETEGFSHFVVIKGVKGGKVLVGDPARGLAVYDARRFERLWNGAFLAMREHFETGRKHFNQLREWHWRPSAPVGEASVREPLSSLLIHLPGRNEFGR